MFRVVVVCSVVLATATVRAERWPVHAYTTADGLANDRVDRGTRDGRGFLWFATRDGVSRFDGNRFENFGIGEGLPAAETHDVVATRDSFVWVATESGIAWLDPGEHVARARFHPVATAPAYALAEDSRGTLWVGTADGLARVVRSPAGAVLAPVTIRAGHEPSVLAIVEDSRDNSLWLGTSWGLVHRTAAAAIEQFRIAPADEPDDRVFVLLLDREHRLWIGHVGAKLIAAALPLAPTSEPLWDVARRDARMLTFVPDGGVRRNIFEDSRGTVWIGTTRHPIKYDGRTFELLDHAQLGSQDPLAPCVEDLAGNVWFGGDTTGLVRLAGHGMIAYDAGDGLDGAGIYGFVADPLGPLYAISWHDGHVLARRDGERFAAVRPRVPDDVKVFGWGWGQTALIDRDGRWWYPTAQGVARYPHVDRLEDLAHTLPEMLTTGDGLPGRDVFRIYEDRRGDVWLSTMSEVGLARWDRATGKVLAVGAPWPRDVACAFAEDRSGALWVGFGGGELVRAVGSDVHTFTAADGVPAGGVCALLVDHAGRLWVGTDREGVARLDDPASRAPRFVRQPTLSSQVMAFVEDLDARIYAGTTRGIERIDPTGATAVHYTMADGLPSNYVHVAFRDRDGTLWFGTKNGAARLAPRPPSRAPPAPAYITRLVVGGVPVALAAGGAREVPELELDDDRIDIAFTSPTFAIGDELRFQYRLGDDAAWSTPDHEREVHFPKLAPGHYRFEVRAVAANGATSPSAAAAFAIPKPIYARWWFLASCALAIALVAYALYRRRLAQALAIERVRTRIATDLHDELGANLSRIAILSEVAGRRTAAHEEVAPQVGEIGRSARELVDIASDIVWSTDPHRDDVGSLIARLRSFAGDVFDALDIAWTLDGPPNASTIALEPDQRRHLYLVIKEAINNAAKHSGATCVTIAITVVGRAVTARIHDDGRGFELDAAAGRGLPNMRARAAAAGGTLELRSAPGAGTEIHLTIPLA